MIPVSFGIVHQARQCCLFSCDLLAMLSGVIPSIVYMLYIRMILSLCCNLLSVCYNYMMLVCRSVHCACKSVSSVACHAQNQPCCVRCRLLCSKPTMLCALCSTWSWRLKYTQDGTAMQLCYTSSLSYLAFWESERCMSSVWSCSKPVSSSTSCLLFQKAA